jgi:TolB-like protein/cytochrome c-type biogenesis protein CcmH/NrfG
MSGEAEQEYFCDGIAEDIITELSRFHSLFVIARTSTFAYKGRAVDVRTVAKELGVRYVLEGSVRRSNDRIRLTAQLVDATTGSHLWAEKFDRRLAEVFEVQEELTRRIVGSLAPFIEEAEREKVRRRPENFGAYEIAIRAHVKGYDGFRNFDPDVIEEAIADARLALSIDPRSVMALVALSFCQWQRVAQGVAEASDAWKEGMEAANRAIDADPNDCMGYVTKAVLLAFAPEADRTNDALSNARRGHELNPNNMSSLTALAFSESVTGHAANAIEHLHEVLRISPRDPIRFSTHNQLAIAYCLAGLYAEGVAFAERGLEGAPGYVSLHTFLAANCVGLGDIPRARAAFAEARRISPAYTNRALAGGMVFRDPEQLQRITRFLRIAAGVVA